MKGDESADAFECILEKIHPFGYFQKRLLFLTTLLQVLAVTVLLYLDVLQLHLTAALPACESSDKIEKDTNISNPLNISEVANATCIHDNNHFNKWTVPKVRSIYDC